MLNSLSSIVSALPGQGSDCLPLRKTLTPLPDDGTFVLPLRQSLIKNRRLMPGTLRLIALLAAWQGVKEQPVETTQRVLARHLGRSTRQVYRYLKDAMEEGYLTWSQTTNRLGYVIGIRVRLSRVLIFGAKVAKKVIRPMRPRKPARTYPSPINETDRLLRQGEDQFRQKIREISLRHGFDPPSGG